MKKAISLLLALVMLCSLLVACGNGKTTEQPAASAAGETKAEEKPAGDAAAQKTTITVLRPGDQDKVASFMEPAVEACLLYTSYTTLPTALCGCLSASITPTRRSTTF